MGCLHVDSWFARLSSITNFYQHMVCARYTNSISSVRLDSWQSYSGMAEQDAICAAFSQLMQLQTLVEPRLGKLWQERQRHARSVISTATDLERIGELTSLEINHLVDRYAAWLMINLTEREHISMTDGNAHEATIKTIGDVCT